MFDLPTSMLNVLAIFLPLFCSKASYINFLEIFQGHILCKGKRTISEVLKYLSLRKVRNYSRYHDFFRRAKWSTLKGAQILLLYIVSLIPGEIIISVDSTVERRKGPKIKGLGIQRDAVRSTKGRKVLVPGLHWLVFAIHFKFPWFRQEVALPFLSILMPPEEPLSTSRNEKDLKKSKRHKTLTKWSCQVAILLRRWIKHPKKITIVADSAFATYALANTCIDLGITLVSRMRLDARTFEFPEEKRKKGRKNLVGNRLPTFKMMAEDPSLVWNTLETSWYGGRKKKLDIATGTCLWYGYGIRPVPIRWVLTRDSNTKGEATILFSTDLNAPPTIIIESFINRWQIEVTFEEARRHLGMETQRQWSDKAIDRITPCILASYSIINLMALEMTKAKDEAIPIQTSSWYQKTHVTFSDVLAYVRAHILRRKYILWFDKNGEVQNSDIREMLDLLTAA